MSDKSKCPVFGCTIPRGIPHEHPAGVSAVMRDPVAPLSADERAELESFRRERDWMTSEGLKAFSQHDTYVVPADAIMHGGRKLRDALLLAGLSDGEQSIKIEALSWKSRDPDMHQPTGEKLVELTFQPAPRRTLAQSVGKFMAWIMCPPFLGFALFVIGEYFGWWA